MSQWETHIDLLEHLSAVNRANAHAHHTMHRRIDARFGKHMQQAANYSELHVMNPIADLIE